VAEAVVAALREPLADEVRLKLAAFQLKEWKSSYHWLDANGLALYFGRVVRTERLESCLPREVWSRLYTNHADNQSRLQNQLLEFRIVNQCFQEAEIRYVCLKGFSLTPDYCPDLSLRYQVDLDFIVARSHRRSCQAALEKLGYRVTVEEADTLELKPPEDHLPSITELYKPRRQQGIEVHFASPTQKLDLQEDCLERTTWDSRFGFRFPRLSEPDMFFSLVFHLYRHLLSEWVRLSWFYELDWCLRRHASDVVFWRAVLDRIESDQQSAHALAVVMAFGQQAFASSLPEPLATRCSTALNESTQRWIRHYGSEMLFSDFPGNKLYLLLSREINSGQKGWRDISRKRLLPFHVPARVLHGNSWAERVRHVSGNTKYGISRFRFHVREGFRYLKEQSRWKRINAQAALLDSGSKSLPLG